ncbi:peptidoglycan recognition protein [Streptomyces sp. NPDC005012]|uniref:peptidoglycan recognition protein family protein n=1 Tax=unclassified Streptomyces TaxID=2593676 RepID=UPI0033B740EC
MRGFLSSTVASSFASSLGITCATSLVVPLAVVTAAPVAAAVGPPARAYAEAAAGDAGSTQSLPLAPLGGRRAATAVPGQVERGLARRDVRPFSLVGVVWDDPGAELHGRVQVRTRATATGKWSPWEDLETHTSEHGADPGTDEDAARGGTAPLWVGASDGVEVRARPGADGHGHAGTVPALPSGLRVELVDPGTGPAAGAPATRAGAGPEVLPALSREETARQAALPRAAAPGTPDTPDPEHAPAAPAAAPAAAPDAPRAAPYIGPRPAIVTRRGWKANESLREAGFAYTKKVKVAFVHHTATGNRYTCKQAPSVIRSIYRYHVGSMGWRDIGYNFLVDKCGKVYEGRAGGVARPVMGAHTLGFNSNSMGIAVIGSFGSTKPSAKAVRGIARLTAWKLGLHGMNPRGKTYLTSGGGNRYRKGKNVRLNTISGHRDGFATSCPGGRLYSKLGTARSTSARYQGR